MIYVLPGDLNSVKPDKKFLMKTGKLKSSFNWIILNLCNNELELTQF